MTFILVECESAAMYDCYYYPPKKAWFLDVAKHWPKVNTKNITCKIITIIFYTTFETEIDLFSVLLCTDRLS